MATLPTLAKTWQLSHTTVAPLGSGLADLRRGLRTGIVDALLGFGTPPTVVGSSDSSTSNMSGTNLWTTDGALVWANAGTAHSWIVLKFGNTKFQLCIDLSNNSIGSITVVVSAVAGFTGGSTTNRPTATDEVLAINNTSWVNTTGDTQRVWHVWMPTDSSALRVVMYLSNTQESWWLVELPVNTSGSWTGPIIAQVHFASTLDGWSTYGNLNTTGAGVNAKGPGGAFTVGFTSEAIGGVSIGQTQTIVNGIDGGYPIMPIGIYSATVGQVGRHGSLQDIWYGSTTIPNTGDFYPNDATRQFVQIGDLIYPWDGTASLATA